MYVGVLSGDKEVDYESDFWADHDENCHGDPEDFVDDPDFEGGFLWSCCGEIGSAKGCVVSRHVPKRQGDGKRARVVLGDVSGNSSANDAAAASFRGPGGRSVMD